MFRNFFRIVGVKGEVWGPIFPGAHVGKIFVSSAFQVAFLPYGAVAK